MEVESEVKSVTVFLEGAQVNREKTIELTAGKQLLRFTGLSDNIDARSVQVKAKGEIMVLSVNHQQNYLKSLEQSADIQKLKDLLKDLDDAIKMQNTLLIIIREEMTFLQANRDIGGQSEVLTAADLQDASEFYGSKYKSLKLEELKLQEKLTQLMKERGSLQNQLNSNNSEKENPEGEILVKVDVQKAGRYILEISYMVEDAGWYPSYDLRAGSINQPVELVYKANVRQNTRVDWKNVHLSFSSSDPNISGNAPELQTYWLNYGMIPPQYDKTTGSVSGIVYDAESGEVLPGASLTIQGSTIGTITDSKGAYSLTLPPGAGFLSANYIGYEALTQALSGQKLNFGLRLSACELQEVVVTGYGSRVKSFFSKDDAAIAPAVQSNTEGIKIRGTGSIAIPAVQVENQTSVNFEIHIPYSIHSDNKVYTVDLTRYELPAEFHYYSVPKLDNDAFLMAEIVDWEKYKLLAGEASVFFEDTYVGKTLLDVRYARDTLRISLGRDKAIHVEREKIKEFSQRKLIGTKREEIRSWKTTIRNNKTQPVFISVIDQIPVSMREEIEVELLKSNGGSFDPETGELKWEIKLKAGEVEEKELRYSVRFPKNRQLLVQ